MPKPKRPYVASADQIRIVRDGDFAIIEYADDTVAGTQLKVGAEKLAAMTDEQVLDYWNRMLQARDEHREAFDYTAVEIPLGKPQIRFNEVANQWAPRGDVLRCQLLTDSGVRPALDEPFVAIDGHDLTLAEFMTMVGTFGGWGMRIEFVPDDELHVRPKVVVREPDAAKGKRATKT
ncbi:MAG: hypothetical protein ACHREM_18425 [Polyangiales bacterium]